MHFNTTEEEEAEQQTEGLTAQQWRELRLALGTRLDVIKGDIDSARSEEERAKLVENLTALKEQIGTLQVEEAVAQFVEDAERYTMAQSAFANMLRRDPDEEIA